MSWTQEYNMERLVDFAYRLYLCNEFEKKRNYDLFIKEIFEKIAGYKVIKIEDIVLDDDFYNGKQMGKKITFDTGIVYIHKLVEKYRACGNYGCDTYKLTEENQKVDVKEINEG